MVYSEIRAEARDRLRGNWGQAIGTALMASLLGGSISSANFNFNWNINAGDLQNMPEILSTILIAVGGAMGLLGLAQFIIGGTVQLGYAGFLLRQNRRQDPRFSDLFSEFYRIGRGFAQMFLVGLYTFLWTLLLIIPGIVKSYSYAMTPFIMADHPELTANQAIARSRQIMNGHKWELFVLDFTFLGWMLLGCLTMGIGLLWVIPYVNAAHAAFYREITKQTWYIET